MPESRHSFILFSQQRLTGTENVACAYGQNQVTRTGDLLQVAGDLFQRGAVDGAGNVAAQVSGGNRYYDPDGTSSYDNPIVINALVRELQAELEDEIWMPKHTYLFDGYHDHRTAFCTSKLASLVTNSMTQKLHIIQDNGRRSIPQFQTGFAPYPVEEKGQTNYAAGVTPTVHVGIAENAPNETAAWAFVKWMSTYGSGYLCAGGYVPTWKGAKPEKMAEALYGDLDTAAQWVDMESFCRVLGRTDLPIFENTMFHYLKGVTNVLSQKQEIEDIIGIDASEAPLISAVTAPIGPSSFPFR